MFCAGGEGGVAHGLLAKSKNSVIVGHRGIACSEWRQAPARLNEMQIRGVVHRRVRDEILFGKRRDYHVRYAAVGNREIAGHVVGREIHRFDSVRARHRQGRYMVEEASTFVVSEEDHANVSRMGPASRS